MTQKKNRKVGTRRRSFGTPFFGERLVKPTNHSAPWNVPLLYCPGRKLCIKMKVVALLSGGKDSCYNMMKCIEHGHDIVALANLKPALDAGSWCYGIVLI